jgi:hypothetical protein
MKYDNNPKFIKRSYVGRDVTYERKTPYGDGGFVIRGIRGVTRGDSSMNAFYDSEGNFIKATRTEGGKTIQVPKGAKVGFFRMLGRKYRTNPVNRFDETLQRYHGGDDPSRQEMIEHIKGVYGRDADRFDIEEAIYWFANDYHGGQASNLYSALSTSEYRPGQMSSGPEEGSMSEMIYADLVDTFAPTKRNPRTKRESPLYVKYLSLKSDEEPFMMGGTKYEYVWAEYPGGIKDIGVYSYANDLVYSYDAFRQMMNLPNPLKRRKGETQREFMSRCMSEEHASFPQQRQRVAVCLSKSRRRNPVYDTGSDE